MRQGWRWWMWVYAFSIVLARGVQSEVIWDNGTYATNNVALSIGWNQSVATPYRYSLTDDFVLTAPCILKQLVTYGFMQGNTVNLPQVQAMYVCILADDNGQPGAPILGGFQSGLPFTETYTGTNYLGQSSAPIYKLVAELPDWQLCSGHYWIQYNVDQNDIRPSSGNPDANYFSTLVQPPPPGSNGWHYSVLQDQFFSLQGNAPPFAIGGDILQPCLHPGDFDGDGNCTTDDVQPFVEALVSGTFVACADVNGDCSMDGHDVAAFLNCLGIGVLNMSGDEPDSSKRARPLSVRPPQESAVTLISAFADLAWRRTLVGECTGLLDQLETAIARLPFEETYSLKKQIHVLRRQVASLSAISTESP